MYTIYTKSTNSNIVIEVIAVVHGHPSSHLLLVGEGFGRIVPVHEVVDTVGDTVAARSRSTG